MELTIYSTLTGKKEKFVPLTPGEVRMYVCGITAYDLCHVGHARSAIVFDVIRRYLAFKGYRVTFVKNFTDVDDKIIRRANEEGVDPAVVSERYIKEYEADMEALGVQKPDVVPKATEHIPEMIALIERLLAGGFAYVVDGDVYFEVRRFPRYGELSGKNLDELLAGARVEVDERKRDPRDFALWKAAKPGEPSWPSPWGLGRPGWHIECSAMSMKHLGESFDIHGGGADLVFPHHECEIAQSEAATNRSFVRVWIHNGFVNLGTEKMSKSLGNVLAIKEVVKRHHPDSLRLYFLGTHYRNPLDFSEDHIRESARAFDTFNTLIVEADHMAGGKILDEHANVNEKAVRVAVEDIGDAALRLDVEEHVKLFRAGMDDDFNTAIAKAELFQLSDTLSRYWWNSTGDRDRRSFQRGAEILLILGRALGLFAKRQTPICLTPEERANIEALVAQRAEARRQRDWKRADALRSQLETLGVTIEDTPSGTPRWKWKGA